MLLIYKAKDPLCLSGLKSRLLKRQVYTILNWSAVLTCYFSKCAVDRSPFFIFSSAKSCHTQCSPTPAVRTRCAAPSPADHPCRPGGCSHVRHVWLRSHCQWTSVWFWAVWSDVPGAGIWLFFCLFASFRLTEWPPVNSYSLCWVCLPWKSKLIPGMGPDILPHTWAGQQQSHPSSSLSLSPQGKHGTAAWPFELWSVNWLVNSLFKTPFTFLSPIFPISAVESLSGHEMQ